MRDIIYNTEYIDRFLNEELGREEMEMFESELLKNPDLQAEVEFHRQIEASLKEDDIIDLRKNLCDIMAQEPVPEDTESTWQTKFSFELSEDLIYLREFRQPVTIRDIKQIHEGIPVLHLVQHNIAARENIHHFYKEQQGNSRNTAEEYPLSSMDELVFDDIQKSFEEKDILDLRANLKQIASNMPAHPYDIQGIDQYINQELDDLAGNTFEEELVYNTGLKADVSMQRDVDQAIGEKDIMALRAALQDISQTAVSTSRSIENIDQYVNRELQDEEAVSFETEMENNPDLVAEIDLFKAIDSAVQEEDIILLRSRLNDISKEFIEEKQKERSMLFGFPTSRVIRISVASAAAVLVLMIGIGGLVKQAVTPGNLELYSQYFNTYEGAGITRSGDDSPNDNLGKALAQYNEGNYTESLPLLKNVLGKDPENPVGNFYTGMILQKTGHYQGAIACYQHVVAEKNNLFTEQAEWYTGLCYLKTEDKKRAYLQFSKIAEDKGYYSEKAKAIIRKMKYTTEKD